MEAETDESRQQAQGTGDFHACREVKPDRFHGARSATNTLAVKFKSGGATYHYHDVDAKKFAELRGAPSVGSHLHKHIKPNHKFSKLGD